MGIIDNVRVWAVFVLLLLSLKMSAQHADSLAADCLNRNDWFLLQEVYQADSSRMSPFMRQFSKAMLSYIFGRPAEANEDIRALLKTYQETLDFGNIYSLVRMRSKSLSAMLDNRQASETLSDFIRQIEGKVDSSVVAPLVEQKRHYDLLSPYRLFLHKNPQKHYEIPFVLRQVADSAQFLLSLEGSLGGKKAEFLLDTGAGYNVASPLAAKKYGLKVLEGSLNVRGMRNVKAGMAIAESLKIGRLEMRNVPFIVLDNVMGNEKARKDMQSSRLIIGQPFLSCFPSYSIDFSGNEVIFNSTVDSLSDSLQSNLCINDGGALLVRVSDGKYFYPFALDTGSTASSLGPDYYRNHQAEVSRLGKWDIKGEAGAGGIAYNSVFVMPEVLLRVSNRNVLMKQIPVITMSSTSNIFAQGAGRLGIDFFRMWKRVNINNKRMIITFSAYH